MMTSLRCLSILNIFRIQESFQNYKIDPCLHFPAWLCQPSPGVVGWLQRLGGMLTCPIYNLVIQICITLLSTQGASLVHLQGFGAATEKHKKMEANVPVSCQGAGVIRSLYQPLST